MYNNYPMSVSSVYQLSDCWVFENRQYTYYGDSYSNMKLPSVVKTDEDVLKKAGIPYRSYTNSLGEEYLEFWDKDCFEEVSVTLPLYVKFGDEYKINSKKYTGNVPMVETVSAAWALYENVVELAISQKKRNLLRLQLLQRLENDVNGENAIVVVSDLLSFTEKIAIAGRNYRVLPVIKKYFDYYEGVELINTGYYALIDEEYSSKNVSIAIKCPERVIGLVIGKGGWQVNQWKQELGLKYLSVVKID